jgi:octaprenyl-diphosphate synthase
MDQEYIQRLKKIEAELEKWLPAACEPEKINKIFGRQEKETGDILSDASLDSLFTPIKDILLRGGKRWRPFLMTLVCETLGGGDSALPLTPLVEFSHNASLIHDDIEDDSDQRRGKPVIHQIYGVDTAINSGSFLYFLSLCCIESFTGNNKDRIYSLWADNMRRLHLGQAMDIKWHSDIKIIPSIEEYYFMCSMKTGSLARFAAELGALTAGATEQAAQLVGGASEKLGIGFQILDDVKNLTVGIPGKKRGDDIAEGKKSLPVLLYLNRYPEKREQIFYCLYVAKTNGVAVPEIKEMVNTLTEAGVFTEAEEKAQLLIQEAKNIFGGDHYAGAPANEEGRALLDGLIRMIS